MFARIKRLAYRLSVFAAVLLFALWGLSLFLWIGYDGVWDNFEWQFMSVGGWVQFRVTDVSQGIPRGERLSDAPPGLIAMPASAILVAQSDVEYSPKVPLYPTHSPIALEAADGVLGFIAPYWILAGVASIAPAVRLGRRFRAKRRERLKRLQICGRCGYDLRASTGRCPECGEPFV